MSKLLKTVSILLIAAAAGVALILLSGMGNRTTGDEESAAVLVHVVEKPVVLSPMAIESLRQGSYPGGEFTVEEQLADGNGFEQYVVSYRSEGLKIFGLLTIPLMQKPENGFPAIVFVHGYIPPREYSTTRNYASYQARLAQSGFVTFKPDLRGHGDSEGAPVSAHYSEKYVVDTLNAIPYLKDHEDVDPARLGYWGHSNGGEIGLRVLVISPDIKAASLWAGVVGSYVDMFETYNDKIGFLRSAANSELVRKNGLPSTNPEFWNTIEPYQFLADISAAIQIQHGIDDASVPVTLSRRLKESLDELSVPLEYFEYPGDNHNISQNLGTAFQRSIDFYNKHL